MIDRERKQQADRERRERIRNGTWKFPKGGDAEASLGLSSKTTLTAQRGTPAAYTPLSPANPGPAPHSIISEPRGAAPLSRATAPAPALSSSRALAVIPTPAPSMHAGRIVKRPRIVGGPEPLPGGWKDPNTSRNNTLAVGPNGAQLAQHARGKRGFATAVRSGRARRRGRKTGGSRSARRTARARQSRDRRYRRDFWNSYSQDRVVTPLPYASVTVGRSLYTGGVWRG